jgi:hypothetical protein
MSGGVNWEVFYEEGDPGPSPRAAVAWHIQDKALQDLTDECVRLGLTGQQTRRLWQIVAGAYNLMWQEGAL